MKYLSRKRTAMTGTLAATMIAGAGMLITPSALAFTVQDVPAAEKLPAGLDIIKKSIEATGGEAAYKARKSMVTKAIMQVPGMDQGLELIIYQVAPNKMATTVDIPGMGEQVTIFDGESAWMDSMMTGPRLMTGEEKASLKRQAAFDAQYNPEKYYETIETVGRIEFAGEDAFEIRLKAANSDEKVKHYYSVESGLMLGQTSTQVTQMGEMQVRVVLSDYRQVGDLKMPFKTTLEYPGMGMTQTLTISSIELDVEVDPKIFEMPDEIKQLKDQERPTN